MGGVVALVEEAGTSASTTAGMVLSAAMPAEQPVVFAECDPSGGDVAAWAEMQETPGWETAVAAGDRSWQGLRGHVQELPSGLSVLCAPTQPRSARTVVREAASRFGALLGSMSDVVTVADCGRLHDESTPWLSAASIVLLLVRQAATSAGATVARVDRSTASLELLGGRHARVGVLVVGSRPYDPVELAGAMGGELFGVLPEDPIGAGLAAGAWTVGRGAARSALVRAARPVAVTVVEALSTSADVVPFGRSESVG